MANNNILSGVWLLNETLESLITPQLINFTFNRNGVILEAKGIGYYSTSPTWLCYFKTTNVNDDFYIAYENDLWNNEYYRKITIAENQENATLLSWLQVNAVKTSDSVEGLTDEVQEVKDIFREIAQEIRNKYNGFPLPPMQPRDFAQRIREYTNSLTGQQLNDLLQDYMANIAEQFENESRPRKRVFLIDFTELSSITFKPSNITDWHFNDGQSSISANQVITITDENSIEMTFDDKNWKLGWAVALTTDTQTISLANNINGNFIKGYYLSNPLDESGVSEPVFTGGTNTNVKLYSIPREIRLKANSSNNQFTNLQFNWQSVKFIVPFYTLTSSYATSLLNSAKFLDVVEIENTELGFWTNTYGLICNKLILKNQLGDFTQIFTTINTGAYKEIIGMDFRNTAGLTLSTSYSIAQNLRVAEFLNIKINLQISRSTSYNSSNYGSLDGLTKECLINNIRELVNVGASRTFTIGYWNLQKIANVYVRLLDEPEVDETLPKVPFELCESTDNGAMLISEYMALKNWTLA